MAIVKSQFIFTDAPATERKARIALMGPTGSGKTFTGLEILGQLIEPGQLVAVIDTERESAYVYRRVLDVPFKWVNLTSYHPEMYIGAIEAAENAGIFGGLLIDSLSHAWMGKDGALELVDQASARSKSSGGNNFFAWREVTPFHNALVNKLLACTLHLVVTMRSKMEYVVEESHEKGQKRTSVRKVGLQPIQRDGLEYEFDVVGDLEPENNRLVITKTRCTPLTGKQFVKDGVTPGKAIREWLKHLAETSPAEPMAPAASELSAPLPETATPVSSDPSVVALCDDYIAQIREATAENIFAIKDQAKVALEHDKPLLAKFQAVYNSRYATVVPQRVATP